MADLNLIGQRFDRLFVVARVINPGCQRGTWACVCDCGNQSVKYTTELRNKRNKTIMCLECRRREQAKVWITHGLSYSDTAIYRIWTGIRKRCRDPKDKGYKYYGAKGIDRCAEWDDFKVFRDWALSHGYEKGLSLDRLDPTKGYNPSNCEWVTKGENSRRANEYNRRVKCLI